VEDDILFTFTGYDGQHGFCRPQDSGYVLGFGAMLYYANNKEELRDTVAWCICPVTFTRPENI